MAKIMTALTDIFRCKKHDFSSMTQTECPLCKLENEERQALTKSLTKGV